MSLFTGHNELLFLVHAIHPSPGDRQIHALKKLSHSVNWEKLYQLLQLHRSFPMFFNTIHRFKIDVPEHFNQQAAAMLKQGKLRSLLVTSELLLLDQLFSEAGMKILHFKGPALSAWLYGDTGMRQYRDLDLLINQEQLEKGMSILENQGYQLVGEQQKISIRQMRQLNQNFTYIHKEKHTAVELHWRLFANQLLFPISNEAIWQESSVITIGSRQVLSFSPELHLLYLSVHGSVHVWENLFWLTDIAAAIQKPGLNWEKLNTMAKKTGTMQMLALALYLSKAFFEIELPDQASAIVSKHHSTWLAKKVVLQVKRSGISRSGKFMVLFSLRKNLQYRLHLLFLGVNRMRL